MAKRATKAPDVPDDPPMPPLRDRLVTALLDLLAERSFDSIDLADVATRAGVSLADMRGEVGSTFDLVAAFARSVDKAVLAGTDPSMATEPARERLFDVLMRRIETLAPHKSALQSLFVSGRRDPRLAMGLNQLGVRSMQWMLAGADIDAAGAKGAIRAQGLTFLFARVLDVWFKDDDPGLARTMAKLDTELASGARMVGMLNDLSRFVPRCAGRRRAEPADLGAGI
jgi:AcrR family transcriptional regulator